MDLREYHVPATLEQFTNYFSYMGELLAKILYDARRCSETFKSDYQRWNQHRCTVLQDLTQIHDAFPQLNPQNAPDKVFIKIRQVAEALVTDQEIFQNLLTRFDEYLKYAGDIKRVIEEAKINDVNLVVVSIVQTELQDYADDVTSVPEGDWNIFDILPLLNLINTWSEEKMQSVGIVIEILSYLACQWNIVEELNTLQNSKGPVCDISLFPDKFLDESILLNQPFCYYDLVANLSIASSAENMLMALQKMNYKNIVASKVHIFSKLEKVIRAMANVTRKTEHLTELLIAET